jgi:hypothetical protein
MKDRFITAYSVTRHYGGPEEGGWWYNWYTVVETINIPKVYQKQTKHAINKVHHLEEALRLKHDDINEGNINHVTGGVELQIYFETNKHEFETTERPYYC